MGLKYNITSGQASRPIMGIVQDCLVGSYLMTLGWVNIEPGRFNDICTAANLDLSRLDQIQRVYDSLFPDLTQARWEKYLRKHPEAEEKKYASLLYTGRGLLSMALPPTFFYNLANKAHPQESVLKIRNGCIIEGTLDKSAVGPKSGAIHHFLSPDNALHFLTKVQHIVNNWLRDEGFGVGISDCIPNGADEKGRLPSVKAAMDKAFEKAQLIETTQSNPLIAEIKINSALNAARDITAAEAKKEIRLGNRFYPLIHSGSKGSMVNLTQIVRLLGQQNIEGKRVEPCCLDGVRTLPHFSEKETDPLRIYQARGFVDNSFFQGLNPINFRNHAASGREGLINTAVSTARTGYCQRRITEMLRSITVEQDATVRDANGRIIQFVYGGDGLAPAKQHRIEGQLQCHVLTGIEELNTEFEMKTYMGLADFRAEHGLTIETQHYDDDRLSQGSGEDDENSPESPGSAGSVEFDYDD